MQIHAIALTALTFGATFAASGPIAWGICQTACNAAFVTCVVAAVGTMGPAAVAAAPGCSTLQGVCMAACTPLLIAPTP